MINSTQHVQLQALFNVPETATWSNYLAVSKLNKCRFVLRRSQLYALQVAYRRDQASRRGINHTWTRSLSYGNKPQPFGAGSNTDPGGYSYTQSQSNLRQSRERKRAIKAELEDLRFKMMSQFEMASEFQQVELLKRQKEHEREARELKELEGSKEYQRKMKDDEDLKYNLPQQQKKGFESQHMQPIQVHDQEIQREAPLALFNEQVQRLKEESHHMDQSWLLALHHDQIRVKKQKAFEARQALKQQQQPQMFKIKPLRQLEKSVTEMKGQQRRANYQSKTFQLPNSNGVVNGPIQLTSQPTLNGLCLDVEMKDVFIEDVSEEDDQMMIDSVGIIEDDVEIDCVMKDFLD